MPCPKTIKVGGQNIKLRRLKRFPKGDRIGDWNYEKQAIRIKDGLPPYVELDTLTHEKLHACLSVNGWQYMIGDHEEQLVTVLAGQLAQSMVDNPQFWEYLLGLAEAVNEDSSSRHRD